MTLLLMDSFETHDNSNMAGTFNKKYPYNASCKIDSSVYKTGTQSFLIDSTTGSFYTQELSFPNKRAIIGFHFRRTGTNSMSFLQFCGSNGLHTYITSTSTTLKVYRAAPATLLGTGTVNINVDTWYHIEIKMTISDSIGADDCIVKVNGVEDINLTSGTDTRNNGVNDDLTNIRFYNQTFSVSFNIDNLYILNDAGGVNDDFIGEAFVECKRPNGNGASSQWDGSDGNQVDNYQLVDESLLSESDYLEAQSINETDLFQFENISVPSGAEIIGVQCAGFIEKMGVGDRRIKKLTRVNGSNYEGTETYLPSGDPALISRIWETNPNTSLQWQKSEVDAAEFGIKVSA